MKVKRMEKLISFLEGLEEEKFYFGDVVSNADENGCGTVCCAIGWTPKIWPDIVKWTSRSNLMLSGSDEGSGYIYIAHKLFNISETVAGCLFTTGCQDLLDRRLPKMEKDSSPKEVAHMLKKFLFLVNKKGIKV